MNRIRNILCCVLLFCFCGTADWLHAQSPAGNASAATSLTYPIPKSFPSSAEELLQPAMADLKLPENISTVIEYDINTGDYVMVTRMGDAQISVPITLTKEEYDRYWQARSSARFFKGKNKIDYSKKKDEFSLTDMKFDLGAAEKIFGPGGVQLRTQGSAEVSFGVKNNIVENPSLSERARNRTYFDFDQSIQLSVNGKVGDKMNVNMNYDTEATFGYDTKNIKLRYAGKEDEIIKSLEAGNVSMPVKNSLVTGATSLFGVKTQLQFGKLNVSAVLSQQKTQMASASMDGGSQTTAFEIASDAYDENRHFFLSHYFRDNYDAWMSKLPYISSGVVINKVEVWVTNKRADMSNARNILAFSDMAEPEKIANPYWTSGTSSYPSNAANKLYSEMVGPYALARDIIEATSVLAPLQSYGIEIGKDYERLESARLLRPSEYKINTALGYISLNMALNADEVLAVAYEYTKNGQVYQVGEFSTDGIESPKALYVKLLKGTDFSPASSTWDLMMKNVYSIGAYNMPKEDFVLNVTYQNDSVGSYLNYLTEGNVANTLLLRVMNLDRLNLNQENYPDGQFDYVEGYTVQSANGRIIFPVLEPFGSHLRKKIGDDALADNYVFQELYDSTLTVAQQLTEKNKFRLQGEYKASNGAEIHLNAVNVARGSVKVTAAGRLLTENVDYTVDYISGTVTITNMDILSSGTQINATCEDQGVYSMVRKSMAGIALEYVFSDHFSMGGTLMHLSEKPLTNKVDMNTEPLNNTIWGLNTAFDIESQGLTKLLDKIPLINVTQPSKLTMKAEFAQLIPGESKQIGNTVYVDDFEAAKKSYSLKDMTRWFLASTPYDPSGKFVEAAYSNDLRYGMNRALLSWYHVDGIFTQSRSQTPDHIRNDKDQLSNHFVRAVNEKELYPDKDLQYNQTGLLSVMNLAYYPKERGPYNFDVQGMNPDGTLSNPEDRWGGIMRRIESSMSNFESSNVEYIEFWMLDPFIYDTLGISAGGDLYFNLGEISEDVLKDGRKSFENGLPTDGDSTMLETTVWGKVSGKTVNVYAFDNTSGIRKVQDVGLDGLNDEEERHFFREYVSAIQSKMDAGTLERMKEDPFSPLNDPSGDNYHHYRGSDFDRSKTSILERYKRYNGTEGNSRAREDTNESYETAATTLPDVEDINEDFTLNETERYYQYKVSIRPNDMVVGKNYINDKQTTTVRLKNGESATVSWYQFKIPVHDYNKKIGTINGFNSIRFIRMYLTNFQDSTILRFGTLDLVRGDWRAYTKDLYTRVPETDATFEVSTIGLEENSSREPIHYVLPPGVEREGDPSQPGVYQENEQSLSLKVLNLSPGDARAVYKNISLDFRQYDRLQLFVHGEALMDDVEPPLDYEMTVFIRLGTDFQSNYYEYEIPLKLSPHHIHSDRSVWPDENFMDISLELLTRLKKTRNVEMPGNYTKPYWEYDPEYEQNKVTIKGNPTLSEIRTIMIGIRSNATVQKSVEVWANELRLYGFNDDGGWAAMANATLALSDLGTVTFSGQYQTDGFGGLEQRVSQRRLDNYSMTNIAMSFDLGKLYPKSGVLNFPVYYSISKQSNTPKYDPLNQDLLLKDVLEGAKTEAQKDSIKNYSQALKNYRSFNVSNLRLNIKSKTPLPVDPANFSLSYSFSEQFNRDAKTEYEITQNYRAGLTYGYSSPFSAWTPFAKSESKLLASPWMKILKEFDLGYVPNSISFSSNLTRYYYELQNRDLTSGMSENLIPVTFSKNFLWNTDFNLNWNLTKNMKLTFSLNNISRIEETLNSPVNKDRYRTEYEHWKDTVMMSIKEFGSPLNYQQNLTYTWQIPFNRLPVLDFMTANFQYNTTYKWDRSAQVDNVEVGNTISNQRSISLNPTLNLETLYNKSTFLSNANKKYATSLSSKSKPSNNTTQRNNAAAKKAASKTYEKTLVLMPGKTTEIKHGLKNKRVSVRFVNEKGVEQALRYKVLDENTLRVQVKDSISVKTLILPKPDLAEEKWYQLAQLGTRLLMSVRNISITYQQTDNMTLPGFRPESGLIFSTEDFGRAPGWDFATGLYGDDYLQKAINRNWLVMNDSVVSPAIYAQTKSFRVKSSVLPIPDLKIELSAHRTQNSNRQVQFMIDGMPETKTGSFSISTILLRSFGASSKAGNGYRSDAFDRFLSNREVVTARLEGRMRGHSYPNRGFLQGTPYAGNVYDSQIGGIDKNSADVLIPAFLAAYTGKSAYSSDLSVFPSLKAMLPNWTISYNGLTKIPAIKKHFKSLSINHGYNSTYNVTSYHSFNSFVALDDQMGFVQDVVTGNPLPSSPYDISSVSLTESFNPLISIQGTLVNGMTLKTEVRTSRTLNLSITGGQLVEQGQHQYVLGSGYTLVDFHPWGILANSKSKNDLKLTADFSFNNSMALIRKIEENYSQATSGNKTCSFELMADYTISKSLTLKLYYDLESSIPLVSSYPVKTQDFGISIRFMLTK